MTDDWSSPSLYHGGNPAAPPLMAGADPMASALFDDWFAPEHDVQWSATTYVGQRRHRPAPGAHAAPPEPEPETEGAVAVDEAPPESTNRGMLATSRAIAVASLASRVTGFLRSSLLVAALGTHQVADAYNVANNLPNMVYELLLGGVLSSVLIPLLVHAQEDDDDNGVAYTQRLLSIATAALGAMTLLAVVAAPLFANGLVADHSERSLASIFATLLLPEIFFYGLGAMLMAVLNVRHSFAPGAWAPVLNNVILIATVCAFWALPGPKTLNPATMTTAQILVIGLGTTLGIVAQALVLFPALRRSGFFWQWRFRARPNEVGRMKEVSSLAGWVLAYVVASQIGVTVIAKVGVTHHAFTAFTNADLLLQMPYGILVVSLLTAIMPRLSRAAARGQSSDVVDDLGLGARLSAVALLPITAGFIVLSQSLTVVLFAYGQNSIADARAIGTALAASAFGLFPFAIVMLQLRVFYAMRDGRTPALINAFMVATKVAIVIGCANTLDTPIHFAEGLTVATSASYVVGAVVGHITLTRRLGALRFGSVGRVVGQIGLASVIGAAAALAVVVLGNRGLGDSRLGSVVGLVGGGLVGLAVMVAVAWRLRIPEVRNIASMTRHG
ncbi:murein biosynthesis integral membrane protein MurJ [Jatrophihabitans sp.]|uniref:murein biosynthesis integral membrane protein MurJ n=1 Tax=Jatrophihabitans sp. TaxID=1932789 RepID=UPI0030C65EF9|nr:integral rane protein MviN [Jatrophihabitans sp.]